jgi:hypothetical protein
MSLADRTATINPNDRRGNALKLHVASVRDFVRLRTAPVASLSGSDRLRLLTLNLDNYIPSQSGLEEETRAR